MTYKKYNWNYYTTPEGAPSRDVVAWNSSVHHVEMDDNMFSGDLNDARMSKLREDTKGGGFANRCIMIMSEHRHPLFIICNGEIYEVDTQKYKLRSDRSEFVREEDEGVAGLGALFG